MCRSPPKKSNQPYVSAKNFSGPTTPTYTYTFRYRRCESQKLVHIEAPTHLSLGTYVHTFFFFSTTVISSIPFNCYPYHSLAQTQTRTLQAKYLTLPYLPRIFKLSIHPVRELVAGCFRLKIQDSQAASGRGDCKQRGRITLLPIRGNFSKKEAGAAQCVDGRLALVVDYVCYS